jgi:single-strand DNA-binding protein
MNNVNMIGRLTKDPEVRKTDGGRSICTFTLAVDDTFSKEDRADFIRCTVFGNQGDNCERYLRKGFLAGVSGRIRTDSYKDSDGVTRYPVNVVAERVQFLQWADKKEVPAKEAAVAEEATPEAAEDEVLQEVAV